MDRAELEAEARRDALAWAVYVVLCLALLAGLLWPSSAAAQVAGLCGPGKACSVHSLHTTTRVTTGTPTAASEVGGLCLRNPAGTPWMFDTSTAATFSLKSDNASAVCPRPGFTSVAWTFTSGSTPSFAVSGTSSATAGFAAAQSFAAFPACAAGTNGRLLYDSTNGRWRTCDGAGTWRVLAHEWTLSGYLEDGSPRASYTMVETKPAAPGVVTNLHAQLTNAGPTSASGNYIIKVRDETAGTDLCTLTKTCASGTGSTTCSGAVVAGNRLTIVADSSACGAGTLGSFNVVAHITGG